MLDFIAYTTGPRRVERLAASALPTSPVIDERPAAPGPAIAMRLLTGRALRRLADAVEPPAPAVPAEQC